MNNEDVAPKMPRPVRLHLLALGFADLLDVERSSGAWEIFRHGKGLLDYFESYLSSHFSSSRTLI